MKSSPKDEDSKKVHWRGLVKKARRLRAFFVACDLTGEQKDAGRIPRAIVFQLETKVTETRYMKLDRNLQRKILTRLSESYPVWLDGTQFDELTDGVDEDVLDANLYYLSQHGLIEDCLSFAMGGEILINLSKLVCTAQGMDFLADDGGLGAILGTVTVKLHEDTLRQLIEAKVKASDAPEEQKSGILKALREAPGDAIKHLTEKLLDLGLENAPKALPLIQTLLQSSHS